jgi:hypothetical protein
MGWFDKHKPAASDAGKTADEQSEAQVNALVEKLGASLEERIAKPLREDLTALKTEWETIKAEATKPPEGKGPTNTDGTPRELSQEEKNTLGTQAAFAQSVLTNARLTEREVLDSLPADFADLIPEIRAYFTDTPLDRKSKSDYAVYCSNCADLVIAKHARKAGLRRNPDNKTFFLEDKSAGGDGHEPGPLSDPSLTWRQETASGTRVWTPEEQLRKLDIDPAKFAESVKKGVV